MGDVSNYRKLLVPVPIFTPLNIEGQFTPYLDQATAFIFNAVRAPIVNYFVTSFGITSNRTLSYISYSAKFLQFLWVCFRPQKLSL